MRADSCLDSPSAGAGYKTSYSGPSSPTIDDVRNNKASVHRTSKGLSLHASYPVLSFGSSDYALSLVGQLNLHTDNTEGYLKYPLVPVRTIPVTIDGKTTLHPIPWVIERKHITRHRIGTDLGLALLTPLGSRSCAYAAVKGNLTVLATGTMRGSFGGRQDVPVQVGATAAVTVGTEVFLTDKISAGLAAEVRINDLSTEFPYMFEPAAYFYATYWLK